MKFFSAKPHYLFKLTFRCEKIRPYSTPPGDSDRLKYLLKIMPKEQKSTLRHLRPNYAAVQGAPSEAFLQVIGDGSAGSPSAVMLVTSSSRYLFNCGEGTQRFIHEHKLRLARVENVFFTTKSWKNIGGLPGLSLTVKDIGVPKLTLHGPKGINDIYAMTKRFLQVAAMEIDQTPPSETVYSDHAVTIHSIHLIAETSGDEISETCSRKRRRSASPNPKSFTDMAVAYVGRIADKPGALVMAKCIAHGVPPGPLLAQLKDGQDVLLKDGRTVKANDVRMPNSPGPVFMIVECPTDRHIESLLTDPLIKSHQQSAEKLEDAMEVVIHLTPSHVLRSEKYERWMNQFLPSTQHLIINDSNCNPNTVAPFRIQAQLNMLDDSIFPLLPAQKLAKLPESQPEMTEAVSQSPALVIPARPLMSFYLRPARRLDTSSCFQLDNQAYQDECRVYEGLPEAVEEYRKSFPSRAFSDDLSEPDVTFLGTGSSIPSKARNVSGILLRVNRECSILLDCGEGSAGQLVRFFGLERSEAELRKVNAVFLSHAHADHHLGLIDLIRMRKESLQRLGHAADPLWVFTPEPLISFFESFSSKFEPILDDIHIISCIDWQLQRADRSSPKHGFVQDVLQSLQMKDIDIVDVRHCPQSYGISLTASAGWKICYSGDTMPSDSLVASGRGCDLLLHEATMEDLMEADARKKMHSTTSQAVEIGRKMQAKFTLLTHFSQRYAKIPLLREELPLDVGIAFDNMRIRLSDLPKIPAMLPALKLMFTEHVEEMQARSDKMERRREWERKNTVDLQSRNAGDLSEKKLSAMVG